MFWQEVTNEIMATVVRHLEKENENKKIYKNLNKKKNKKK